MAGNLRHVFNVKNYRAVGDGLSDDADAIENAYQACCEAGGGIVLYPAGTYGISRTIFCAKIKRLCAGESPVIHLGEGKDRTTIKALADGEGEPSERKPAFNMFQIGPEPGAHVFSNMTIDGNKDDFLPWGSEGVGNGIYFDCPTHPNRGNAVREVRFINHHSCGVFSLGDSGDPKYPEEQLERIGRSDHEVVIEYCTFSSIGVCAVFLKNLSGGGVWGCDINDFFGESTKAAIMVTGGKNFVIERNRINATARNNIDNGSGVSGEEGVNGLDGIAVGSCDNYSICFNTVMNVRRTGIQASAGLGLQPPFSLMSRRFICADNVVVNSGWIGIVVDPRYCIEVGEDGKCLTLNTTPVEQWGIITNNRVCTTRSNNGISIHGAKHILLTNNTVVSAGIFGIYLGGSSYCTLTGNFVRNAGSHGVGITTGGGISPVGFHFIGDDNDVENNLGVNYQIPDESALPVDSRHTNIRYPIGVPGAPPLTVDDQATGANVCKIENGFYMVVDDSEDKEQVYICQKIPGRMAKRSILDFFAKEPGKTGFPGFFISRGLRLLDRMTSPCSKHRLIRNRTFHRTANNRYVWIQLQSMIQ